MTQIIDRGNKKWVSLMIPELREGLKEIFTDPPPERPELDEQEIERLNRLLMAAYKTGRPVRIRYWSDDGEQEAAGRIVWFEMGQIRLAEADGKKSIKADSVLGVDILEQMF